MSITIDLPDEVYARLEKQAQVQGMTIAEAVVQILEEIQAAQTDALWKRLKAKGLLAERKPAQVQSDELFQPITMRGEPLFEVIIEERR